MAYFISIMLNSGFTVKFFHNLFFYLLHDTTNASSYIWIYYNLLLTFFKFLQLGIDTIPVIVGPVSYLLLSKPAKGVSKSFDLLSLLDSILPIYK